MMVVNQRGVRFPSMFRLPKGVPVNLHASTKMGRAARSFDRFRLPPFLSRNTLVSSHPAGRLVGFSGAARSLGQTQLDPCGLKSYFQSSPVLPTDSKLLLRAGLQPGFDRDR